MKIDFSLNGASVGADVPPATSLADLLRGGAGATSVHLGCEQGVCGACTILLDGRSVRSCLMIAAQAQGRSIVTAEGVALRRGDAWLDIEAALVRRGAFQCGFCTSGMVVCLEELLEHGVPVTYEEIRLHLSGQICRCTGYAPIVEAFADVLEEAHLFVGDRPLTGGS